jgi:hypothetical protein
VGAVKLGDRALGFATSLRRVLSASGLRDIKIAVGPKAAIVYGTGRRGDQAGTWPTRTVVTSACSEVI